MADRAPTQPGNDARTFALEVECERRHHRHNVILNNLAEEVKQLQRAEIEQGMKIREQDGRLSAGSKRFEEIEQVTKPSLWRMVAAVSSVVVVVIGVVWMLARYPDDAAVKEMIHERSPYLEDRGRIMSAVNGYETTMPSVLIKLGVIDTKLDALIKKLERDDR